METIIKVHPSELNAKLLDKIKQFIGENNNIDVTISLKEYDKEYEEKLNHSIESLDNDHNTITFTMEEFMSYTPASRPGKENRSI